MLLSAPSAMLSAMLASTSTLLEMLLWRGNACDACDGRCSASSCRRSCGSERKEAVSEAAS
jgi:hypothetical protein